MYLIFLLFFCLCLAWFIDNHLTCWRVLVSQHSSSCSKEEQMQIWGIQLVKPWTEVLAIGTSEFVYVHFQPYVQWVIVGECQLLKLTWTRWKKKNWNVQTLPLKNAIFLNPSIPVRGMRRGFWPVRIWNLTLLMDCHIHHVIINFWKKEKIFQYGRKNTPLWRICFKVKLWSFQETLNVARALRWVATTKKHLLCVLYFCIT